MRPGYFSLSTNVSAGFNGSFLFAETGFELLTVLQGEQNNFSLLIMLGHSKKISLGQTNAASCFKPKTSKAE